MVPDFLKEMVRKYAFCRSYRDTGRVEQRLQTVGGPASASHLEFRTAFQRPDGFKFEFHSEVPTWRNHYVIWTDWTGIRRWWTAQPGIRSIASIGMAIAEATGVSMCSAYRVPTLLIPETAGRTLLSLLGEQLVAGEEIVDGRVCSMLSRIDPKTNLTRSIWIDKQELLIRKFFECERTSVAELERIREDSRNLLGDPKVPEPSPTGDLLSEALTTYKPEIDPVLDPSEFEFSPPRE